MTPKKVSKKLKMQRLLDMFWFLDIFRIGILIGMFVCMYLCDFSISATICELHILVAMAMVRLSLKSWEISFKFFCRIEAIMHSSQGMVGSTQKSYHLDVHT